MPLLKELSQTSRDSFESRSDSKESRDVRLNSFKSGIFIFTTLGQIKPNVPGFFRIEIQFERISGRSTSLLQKWHFSFLPLWGKLSRSSRDPFESDSDSKESWDDRLNAFKSGLSKFLRFLNIESIKSIENIEHNPYRSYRSKAPPCTMVRR